MRKLLTILLACLTIDTYAQTGAKHDWVRTPNGFNTIVDWNLKAKSLNLPHYLLTARPLTQDSIGTIFLNTNSADPHIYIKRIAGSTYWPVAYLSDTINYHFLPSTYSGGFYNTIQNFAGHYGLNIVNGSPLFGATAFIRVNNNAGGVGEMLAASSGFTGSGSLLQPNTVFFEGMSPATYVGNRDSVGTFSIFAGKDYSLRQVTIKIDSLRNTYLFHLGNSSVGGDSVLYIGTNGMLKKGFFHGVNSVFGRNGSVVAQSGDYNTSLVTENTNLYFTQARVLATPATGYSPSAGVISATDPLITVINKLQGNITAATTGVATFNGRTGTVTLTTADVNAVGPTTLGTVTAGAVPYSLLTGTVPTWNQNTTGSAATLTTPRAINSVNFDGSAPITITANTPNSLLNGWGVLGGSFNGGGAITLRVDTSSGHVATTTAISDTINAHGASAGYGINPTQFALGNVVVDTAAAVVSKGYLASFAYTKNQINTSNFTLTGIHAFKDSTSSTTVTALLSLDNNFISSATTDLTSPALRLRARRFSVTDQTSDFLVYHEVNDNTAVDQLLFGYSFNSAAPTQIFSLDRFGNFNLKPGGAVFTLTNGNLNLGTAGNHIVITEGSGGYKGQTTLVSGTKAITITGLTTSNRAFISFVSIGGTVTTTWQYAGVCTSNTLTITALTTAGSTNTSDQSVINYIIY